MVVAAPIWTVPAPAIVPTASPAPIVPAETGIPAPVVPAKASAPAPIVPAVPTPTNIPAPTWPSTCINAGTVEERVVRVPIHVCVPWVIIAPTPIIPVEAIDTSGIFEIRIVVFVIISVIVVIDYRIPILINICFGC
jgi:hypothetical protein